MAKPNDFDIPRLYYFESGNIFTGSRDSLNFRIVPKDGEMTAFIWHGFICSELAEMEAEQVFPLSKEGFDEMLLWLEEKYRRCRADTGKTHS